ncbi:MAG: ATP-binding protein [Candidatus Peribacteraceae bacterium]|nr:ATP-binding protein [Candidatus Peribacteraceae bacterium]
MPSEPSTPAMKTHIKLAQVMLAAMDDLLGLHFTAEKTLKGLVKKTAVRQLSEKEKEAIRLYEEGLQKTLDIIAPAGMIVKPNELVLNDLHARTLYTVNWPNYVYPNWLSEEINFDAHMNICQFIYPANSKVIMKMLRKKVTEMRSSVRMLEQRGIVRDPALEAALQDAEELRDLLARGREKLFQMGLYLTIYSDDEEKLKKLETDVESLLGGKLIITKPAFMQMEHGWLSTMPFGIDELEINRNMNTSPLAACFPFSSSDLTDDHGILYGINRHNDSLVIFDRFDLPNANASVFATSGAGKSFTIKLEILRSLMFDTEVYVVDPENEYRELCETVGGTYFRISLESSNHINPFELPKSVRGDEATPGETLRAAVINLHGLLKLMLGTLTPAEDGILDKAILDTYALKGITLATEDAATKMPPTLHDLVDVLETTEGGESMAMTLSKFTEGSYAGLFDQQTNIQLDNQMVVFQIRDLEDQLRPIAMFVIINLIWNRIRAEFKKRMLVIDEAWNLIQYEDSARFLYGLVKRARKYWLGITTITQDVEDFVNSPYGKPIITNSSLQILLKQSASAVDNLQKIFYLTEGEKYLLLNSDVGQGLFFAGNRHVAIQIVASPKEAQIISTKPEDILAHKQQEKLEKERTAAEKKAPPVPQQMVTADEVATTLQREEDAQQAVKDQDISPSKVEPPPIEAAPAEPAKPPETKKVTEAEDVAAIANATLMQATAPQNDTKKKSQDAPAEAEASTESATTPPEKSRKKKETEN